MVIYSPCLQYILGPFINYGSASLLTFWVDNYLGVSDSKPSP